MVSTKYSALSADEDALHLATRHQPNHQPERRPAMVIVLSLALFLSLAVNGFYCSVLLMRSPARGDVTEIFGLAWNIPSVIQYSSPFNDPNRTVEDEAWSSSLVDPATLVIALDDSYTEALGVSHSMRWPWDAKKGVYTFNSAHELHCLHLLRKTINQAYDGEELGLPREHTVHCLEYLLQNVMCYADDTLLYQGRLHQNKHAEVPIGGLGDTRMCRDWSQLQAWAREHSACYNPYVREDDPTFPAVDRYKFCPNGEKPWEHV